MKYIIVCSIALVISVITLLSGFGLGTVLVPVFAVFLPLPLAIASTAVIHLVNNVAQVTFVGRFANRNVVLKFGIPAAISAIIGAFLLGLFANIHPIFIYNILGVKFTVTIIGLIVGLVVILASLFELVPKLANFSVSSRYIPLGGVLSGFLGGLSGNQGTLRSAFLIKSGLNKEQFIGTSAVCSIIVDITRISVYGIAIYNQQFGGLKGVWGLLIAASGVVLLGAYIGSKSMHKITFKTVQKIVGIMLLVLGFAIMIGIGKR
jgi:uncharacterized protein